MWLAEPFALPAKSEALQSALRFSLSLHVQSGYWYFVWLNERRYWVRSPSLIQPIEGAKSFVCYQSRS